MTVIANTPEPPYYAVIFTSLIRDGDKDSGIRSLMSASAGLKRIMALNALTIDLLIIDKKCLR